MQAASVGTGHPHTGSVASVPAGSTRRQDAGRLQVCVCVCVCVRVCVGVCACVFILLRMCPAGVGGSTRRQDEVRIQVLL